MKIQFNTDKNVEGDQRVEAYFSAELEKEQLDLRSYPYRGTCRMKKIVQNQESTTNVA
jgi:hypothetical protein